MSRKEISFDSLSDSELIILAKNHPDAFGELYLRNVGRIYCYLYQRTGNQSVAEDLTSRTFHGALAKLDDYEDKGHPPSAWLFKIAHNLHANWVRDPGRRKTIPLDELPPFASPIDPPEVTVERNEELEALRRAIGQLKPGEQQLLVLKLKEGLSNEEIGEILGRSIGGVKSFYFRTLDKLHQTLTEGTPRPSRRKRP